MSQKTLLNEECHLLTFFFKFLLQSFKTQSPLIPRQLVDVLADSSLGNKFLAYLEDLDKTN